MTNSPPLGPHELYAYEPPISLWEIIKSYVPQHELQEVKILLGESMVEQSLELQQEVQTLLDIWRDYRSETENNLMYHRLPEPPAARERLKHEIKFFIDSIREKSQTNGSNFTDILTKHNKSVLDYALENKGIGTESASRPDTARSSRDGRDTPLTVTSSDRLCQGSIMSNEMYAMKEQLNFLELDSVVHHLQETLLEEVQWLLKDIDFLQNCLEDEADFRIAPTITREPSLADLREERSKLEKDLLADDVPRALRDLNITPNKQRILPNSVIKPQANTTPPSTPPRAGSGRPSPMRASHQISTQVLSLQSDTKTPPGVLINSHNNTSGKRSPSGSQRNTLSRELSSESQRITGSRSLQRSKPLTDQPPTLHRHIPEAPTHLSIRTELPPNSKIVRVGSLAVGRSDSAHHTPSPPSAARPSSNRPGSANRFRRMVLNCRDDT